ncbi:hypothetical protein ACO0QE_004668 [Hanseniaspora vineae]
MGEKLLATKVDYKLNNGNTMPAFGLGTAYPPKPEDMHLVKESVIAAVKAGYRMIDTAYLYGTQKAIGEALQELYKEGVVKREDLFITTKVWPNFWNKVDDSINTSLKDLQTDYVDLALQHWPLCYPMITDSETGYLVMTPKNDKGQTLTVKDADYLTTYRQLEKIYLDESDKRIRNIGVSNFKPQCIDDVLNDKSIKTVPAVNQVELNPENPQLELLALCKSKGIAVTAYSPYGSIGGPILKTPLVKELAEQLEISVNDVLISYLLTKGIIAIPRSWNPERAGSTIYYKILPADVIDKLDGMNKIPN